MRNARHRVILLPRVSRTCGTTVLLGLTLGAAGIGACSPRTGAATVGEEGSAAGLAAAVPVAVDNQSHYNVTVYAVRGGLRQRVGEVAAVSRARMQVPSGYVQDHGGFSLHVRVVGGSAQYVSELLSPQKGDRFLLTVNGRIVNSTVIVQ